MWREQDASRKRLARGDVVGAGDRGTQYAPGASSIPAVASWNRSRDRSSSRLMIVSRQCALDSK